MATQPLIDKYTRSLWNILNVDQIDIWKDVSFDLPTETDVSKVKQLFENTYLYYEIGVETVSRFLDRLKAKVYDLCLKYRPLMSVYADFSDDDIYSNYQGISENQSKYFKTPQTQIVQADLPESSDKYLTEQTNNLTKEKRLAGMTKASAREEYADSLRFLYHEFVKECKTLFMEVF